jgi:hypothetical protein
MTALWPTSDFGTSVIESEPGQDQTPGGCRMAGSARRRELSQTGGSVLDSAMVPARAEA